MSHKTGEAWLVSKQKRAVDAVLAGSFTPILMPLLGVAASAVAITEREKPFITQTRVGKGGRPITIAKLRTMPHGTEETMSNGHYDERRTRLGRIFSMTRLDEVPQLVNVLRGDMSMVGLRPLVRVHHEQFIDSLPHKERKRVLQAYSVARPGWFDPYGIDMYVNGVEDTHEARAESIIKYVYEDASLHRDFQIMLQATGIVKSIVGNTGIDLLPTTIPEAQHPIVDQTD